MKKNDNIFLRVLSSKPMLLLELAALAFFTFNLGKEMLKKNVIKNEVAVLEQELTQLDSEKDELAELLNYARTDSFVELEAKAKLNLAKEGENVLVIPQADRQLGEESAVLGEREEIPSSDSTAAKNNLVRWWEYFFEPDKLWLD